VTNGSGDHLPETMTFAAAGLQVKPPKENPVFSGGLT
jgi:hypothetical protein